MPNKRKILIRLAFLACFLTLVNLGATKFYWYQAIWWFDMLMHFMGGLVIFYLVYFIFYKNFSNRSFLRRLLIYTATVLMIGLGWEIFEYLAFNVMVGERFDLIDTLSDLFFDTFGAIVGFFSIKTKI